MDESPKPIAKKQPLIARRMIVRGVIALAGLALLLVGINFVRGVQDVDLPADADTAGKIGAIRVEPDGSSRAVLIDEQGKVTESPGHRTGARDRDLAWRPDGNRIYFASDREGRDVQVYRWNPASNRVEKRSGEGGTYTRLSFPSTGDNDSTLLVERGGRLFELDPVRMIATPVLPPASGEPTQGGTVEASGAASAFEALFGQLNATSIREGRWVKGKRWVAAVLRREQGEVLILQNLEYVEGGRGGLRPPSLIVAGDRIEFDINPVSGEVVFTALGFQFPGDPPREFIKNGRVTMPFRSLVGIVDPDSPSPRRVVSSDKDDIAYSNPVLSPDGSMLLLRSGRYLGEGDFEASSLVSAPAKEGAESAMATIYRGVVRNASWSPDGRRILFLAPSGNASSAIHEMNADGSNLRLVAQGEFASALYSPQAVSDER